MEIRKLDFSIIEDLRDKGVFKTKDEAIIGFNKDYSYYGLYEGEELCGTTCIAFYKSYVKFKTHFVFEQHRGKGYFRKLLDFSVDEAKSKGYKVAKVACGKMALPEYLKRGAVVTRVYKVCTNVSLYF